MSIRKIPNLKEKYVAMEVKNMAILKSRSKDALFLRCVPCRACFVVESENEKVIIHFLFIHFFM